MPGDENLRRLSELAASTTVAKIVYKKVGEDWHSDRLVEPYSLTHSGSNLILLTWQLEPELDDPAWRNFRVDRITKVSNGGRSFRPRTPVTLHLGEVTPFVMDQEPAAVARSKPSPAETYFRFIETAMLDGNMSNREIAEAKPLQAKLGEQRQKAIHGQVYANLIGEVCMDGHVSPPEEELLRNMRLFLTELGWSP